MLNNNMTNIVRTFKWLSARLKKNAARGDLSFPIVCLKTLADFSIKASNQLS